MTQGRVSINLILTSSSNRTMTAFCLLWISLISLATAYLRSKKSSYSYSEVSVIPRMQILVKNQPIHPLKYLMCKGRSAGSSKEDYSSKHNTKIFLNVGFKLCSFKIVKRMGSIWKVSRKMPLVIKYSFLVGLIGIASFLPIKCLSSMPVICK